MEKQTGEPPAGASQFEVGDWPAEGALLGTVPADGGEDGPIVVANEFADVVVSRVRTRNGVRLDIWSPRRGSRVQLDAVELDCLSYQPKETFSALLEQPPDGMTGRLDGLSALVVGGGSGIGRGVVEAYLREGALVTVLERSERYADELARELGAAVSVVVGDATDAARVEAALSAAGKRGALQHVTCCVGVFDSYASLRDMSAADLERAAEETWRVNVLSALLAATLSYPALRAAHGSLTLTLSGSAFYPEGGGVLYGSSKWALRGVVAHLAKDFAPEVRVNGVAPGGTSGTRLAGLRSLDQHHTADQVAGRDERIRAGNALQVVPLPEDHAGAYVYLADPQAARVVTGVIVNTDGGRT